MTLRYLIGGRYLTPTHEVISLVIALEYPFKYQHRLDQAIGISGIQVHVYKENLFHGNYVVLATDGITSVIKPLQILKTSRKSAKPKKICEAILEEVIGAGRIMTTIRA